MGQTLTTVDTLKILDSMVEAVAILRDFKLLYCNARFYNLVKLPSDQDIITGMSVDQFIDPSALSGIADKHQERLTGSRSASECYAIPLFLQPGERTWVSCRTTVIDWKGEPAVLATFTDITAGKKELDEQIWKTKIFQSAFRLVPDLVIILNADDATILEVNPAFINMTGLRRDDVLTEPATSLPIWAETTFFARFFEELRTNTSMNDIPVALKTRGGIVRHFRLFAQKVVESDQAPLVMLVIKDITDDLAQSRELQKSRDTAELANRAKSEFLANMSHELRTPLNAILGFAEIIRDEVFGGIDNKRYTEYAGDIHDSGRHLLAIINDILDLSKVEAGQLEAHLTWLDPVPSLEMCLSLVQRRAFENGVTLSSDIDPSIMIEADERLIKQIALNLLSNAVKFTEKNGCVNLTLKWGEGGIIILSVEDTGIGMTADEIRIAKRPFGQVDSSLSRNHQGSGLGLPLVSAFSQELRATMIIHSSPGKGTEVVISFPAEKARRKTSEENMMTI